MACTDANYKRVPLEILRVTWIIILAMTFSSVIWAMNKCPGLPLVVILYSHMPELETLIRLRHYYMCNLNLLEGIVLPFDGRFEIRAWGIPFLLRNYSSVDATIQSDRIFDTLSKRLHFIKFLCILYLSWDSCILCLTVHRISSKQYWFSNIEVLTTASLKCILQKFSEFSYIYAIVPAISAKFSICPSLRHKSAKKLKIFVMTVLAISNGRRKIVCI